MNPIKFSDIKQKIIDALQVKGSYLGINESVSQIDGLINQPIYNELTGVFVIGGPTTVPMIAAVGNASGRIYFFALKALIPGLQI